MRIGLRAALEKLRTSLFFFPMMSVLAAIVLGQLGILVDSRIERGPADLPLVLSSTVESARAVLTTIAGATMTFAGIAFSVSLLVIQLGSSQYSPRVVHTLFRDPFNKRVMGLVVGTFTYCLIVMRSVRSALEENGSPVVPNLSVSVAVLLGIAAILATVAFINHSAHSMDISEILERVTRETIAQFHAGWSLAEDGPVAPESPPPTVSSHEMRFDRTGWVQQIDTEALVRSAPEDGTIYLDTLPGRYAIVGTAVCTIVPPPGDVEGTERKIRRAVEIGATRTMQQDPTYGLRQLADVALKALSAGINDPTTAQDAIFHATAVLGEALRRVPPVSHSGEGGRRLVVLQQHTHEDLVRLAFEEVRRAAATHPRVCIYLLHALERLHRSLQGPGSRTAAGALEEQARLVVAGCEAEELLPEDVDLVRTAYRERFGPHR